MNRIGETSETIDPEADRQNNDGRIALKRPASGWRQLGHRDASIKEELTGMRWGERCSVWGVKRWG